MRDRYECHDWDEIGYPGEFVYGDDAYVDDHYMGERWLKVPGYSNYWVSDLGRVYGPGRYGHGRFLTATPDKTGHEYVTVSRNGQHKRYYIHQMMADAFIKNPNNYPLVRHLNDIPYDNVLGNLARGTSKDNAQDAIRNGTAYCLKQRTPVIATDLHNGREYEFVSQAEAARELGLHIAAIQHVLKGQCYQTNGYTFRYVDQPHTKPIPKYSRITHAKVLATNLSTGETCIFNSQKEAEEVLGIGNRMINRVLKGGREHTHGFTFEYVYERGDIERD